MRKVLFLDIDGVVNSQVTAQRHRGVIGIDPYMAFLVGKIVLDTDCEVVLSSTWRLGEESRNEVRRQVVEFIDVTPYLDEGEGATWRHLERGHEIKAWLDAHPDVEVYAILDDDSDMLPEQLPNFFQTTWKEGITKEIAEAVTRHLSTSTSPIRHSRS